MNMTPSMNITPAASHALTIASTSSFLTPTGFSISKCFPACATLTAHSKCITVGSGRYIASTDESASSSS